MNTGTNAADSAAFANRLLTRFGTWKAIVKAEAGAARAEVARDDDFPHQPDDPRDARADREDRRVARDAATCAAECATSSSLGFRRAR